MLMKNVEENVVFLTRKVFISVNFHLPFLCESDDEHFLFIRNNGETRRNKHFESEKTFDQIKVSIKFNKLGSVDE